MFKKLNENKLFEEIYIIAVFLIALIGWYFKTQYGYTAIALISFASILIFNDVKYIVPCGFGMIFSIGTGFTTDQAYGPLVCSVAIFISSLVCYVIRNGLHLSKLKSYKGLLALSILSFIPLLYHNTIKDSIASGALDSSGTTLYILYAGYICYTFAYFIFAMVFKKDSLDMVLKTIGYMSLLLALECILHVLTIGFEKGYRVGWGHCNEAGILMLLGLPFAITGFLKANRKRDLIIPAIKLAIVLVGIICSTSRGTYLFGAVECFALFIVLLIKSKFRKTLIISALVIVAVGLVGVQIKYGIVNLVNKGISVVFVRGFTMSDRFRLYKESIVVWNENWLTRIFGAGIVAELTKEGFEDMNTFIMFHSTFFQCLATTGIIGVLALGYHFYERYSQLKLIDKDIVLFVLIGFVDVDLYGMIDNTYGMYYFMVPIVILMAALDNARPINVENINLKEEVK